MMLKTLSERLNKREISSLELTRHYLEKKDNFGAFLFKNEDALKTAEAVDERRAKGEKLHPLAGIPIAIKDNIITKDIPTTCASKTLEGYLPPYDATVVEKLKSAGLPILGKTNMDEFGMGSTGENSAFFKTVNPKNPELVPGGSSSGSAAAVAGGLAPVALGSDTGGSCRLPAAYCGIVGFKPSYGAVSRFGLIAFASSLDQVGILANSVEDIRLAFDVISGVDTRDMTSREVSDKILCKPKVKNIEELTHPIFDKLLPIYYIISSAEAYSNLSRYDGVYYGKDSAFGDEVKRRMELGSFVLSADNIGEYYNKALAARDVLCQKLNEAFKTCDFIISPTAYGEIPKAGTVENGRKMYDMDKFTVLANLAGLPAVTLSNGTTLMGRKGEDRALLSFAEEVEANGI